MSFGHIFLFCGAWSGVLLGAGLWAVSSLGIFPFRLNPNATLLLLWTAAIFGSFFGLGMATYYQYGKWRYKLPSWLELRVEADDA